MLHLSSARLPEDAHLSLCEASFSKKSSQITVYLGELLNCNSHIVDRVVWDRLLDSFPKCLIDFDQANDARALMHDALATTADIVVFHAEFR